MNIAHLVETLEVGGLERVVLSLAKRQLTLGHSVSIACLYREGALAHEARSMGIEVLDCGKAHGLDLQAVRKLRAALRSWRTEVLHTHNLVAHYYGVWAAIGLPVRRVINTRHGMGLWAASRLGERLYKLAMLRTDYGVAVCEVARRRFISTGAFPERKALTVPNGIDLATIRARSNADRQTLLQSLHIDPSCFVLGTVGRLNDAKDQKTLLRAMRQLKEQQVRVALVVAGDGELRGALEAQREQLELADTVVFLGQRSDVPQILAGLDAFILSSKTEGYSLALVEAAAAGLPIIATDVGGNKEIVSDGVNGLLVPAGDPQALAQAVRFLVADPERSARMGATGRAWALSNGSLEAMCDEYFRIYAQA